MNSISRTSIGVDPRFTIDENWKWVVAAVQSAKEHGILVTPQTIFNGEKQIIGWYLEGWKPPPPLYTYTPPNTDDPFVCDWTI